MMGHNGGPFIFDTANDLPTGMPKMHYFKLDIAAFRKAIFDKPLDIRGAYISVLLALYEHMEPLPANDGMAMLRCGIKDARIWRRVKGTLIELGLINQRASGRLSNPRFEEEITSYVLEFKNRQAAALEREKKAKVVRAQKPTYGLAKPQLSDSYELAKPQLSDSYPLANAQLNGSDMEKTNKYNGAHTTTVPQRTPQADHETRLRARVLELDSNNKEDIGPPETPPVDYRAGGLSELPDLPGLNGSTSLIVRKMAGWLSPHAPDVEFARKTIGEAIKIYGSDAVAFGFAEYSAEIADGKVRVPTVKSLYGFFRQAKGRSEKTTPDKPTETTAERWKRFAAESAAKKKESRNV